MKKVYFVWVSCAAFALASCGDTKKEPAADNPQTEESAALPVSEESQTTESNSSQLEVVDMSESGSSAETAGKNPPHGEPGHRCDIPVGAPLDSPAGGGGTAVPTTPAASSGAASASGSGPFLVNDEAKQRMGGTPSGSSAGSGQVNPPHGQPGHRCDIPVGQPLP